MIDPRVPFDSTPDLGEDRGLGKEAAAAAVSALGRLGDPDVIDILKQRVEAFLDEARTASASFFDTARDRPAVILVTALAMFRSARRGGGRREHVRPRRPGELRPMKPPRDP